MKIANNLSTWLAIFGALPLAVGGVAKGIDTFKYDLLGMSKNEAEAYTKHMLSDHIGNDEETQTASIRCSDEIIILSVAPDGCATLKRKTIDGMVTSNTLVPDPKRAEKIKELYSDTDNGVAYAMAAPFYFGVHKQDCEYKEKKEDGCIVRTYGDGCVLKYEFDKYGNSKGWEWVKYKHKEM